MYMPIDNPHWYRKWKNMLVVSIDLISQQAYYYPCKAEQDISIIILLRMSTWKL